MRKIFFLLTVFFLAVNMSYADEEEDWFYRSENLVLDVNVSSEAVIEPSSSDYSIKYINVNLSHYPYEDFDQEVISLDIYPEAKTESNSMLFTWYNPENNLNFGYQARIKTGNHVAKITEKVRFPILELPEEAKQFIYPSEVIDSDDEDIIGYASELAEGEDDLYVVVHKIAKWTKTNIRYDLSTLTAEVSQKASWVMDNRQGVCDELTSLFIAMLRSLGIPAKFVSGVAYTNSELFEENWGSHGWAEVYFPGYGWVPYDVTYGQFAYLDPTHVKLKESVDSSNPSLQYKWVGKNIGKDDLSTKKLDINVFVDEKIGKIEDPVLLEVIPQKESVGFGSYNLIEAILENKENYYVSTGAYLSKPKEVNVIGEDSKDIMLKPHEKKSVFWMVKLSEDMEDNFIYTMPVTVRTSKGTKAEASFKSKKDETAFTFEEMDSIMLQKQEEESKAYSREVRAECELYNEEFYYYEETLVKCKIKNEGNSVLNGLKVCLEDDCNATDLGIVQEKEFNYSIKAQDPGKHESIFKVENSYVSKAEYISYLVLDEPKIKIKDINAPEKVEYKDSFKVEFFIARESLSVPKKVKVAFSFNNFEHEWDLEELSEERKFTINLAGRDLRKGTNELRILVMHEDDNGRKSSANESMTVDLTNVTFFQNIVLVTTHFLNSLFI